MKTGVYVNLDPDLYNFISDIADDMEWSKSKTLKKIIEVCKQEGYFGNNKKYRKVKRPKD